VSFLGGPELEGSGCHTELVTGFDALLTDQMSDEGEVVNGVTGEKPELARDGRALPGSDELLARKLVMVDSDLTLRLLFVDEDEISNDAFDRSHSGHDAGFELWLAVSGVVVDAAALQIPQEATVEIEAVPEVRADAGGPGPIAGRSSIDVIVQSAKQSGTLA
jgi:hypothetical protein